MADDERRAEIEAVMFVLWPEFRVHDAVHRRRAGDVIAALDRLRDARGNDECRVNLVSSRMCERGTKSCEVEHRSPQSEDHETDVGETPPDDPVTP